MARSREEQFRAKQQLVALFKAQVDLLRQADPDGIGRHLNAVNLRSIRGFARSRSHGPLAHLMLPGLKQGIRDFQIMLDLAYPPTERAKVREALASGRR